MNDNNKEMIGKLYIVQYVVYCPQLHGGHNITIQMSEI